MGRFVKLYLIFGLPLILITLLYTISKGKFYEGFALVELYPEKPTFIVKEDKQWQYSQGFRWIPWASLLKAQIKLLRNKKFHKKVYENLSIELKNYIGSLYKGAKPYMYISNNFEISPYLDSNIIEFYFYDKDREKAKKFVEEIVNIYKIERQKFYTIEKKQLEKAFKEIEEMLLNKIEELSTKISKNGSPIDKLPIEVVEENIINFLEESNKHLIERKIASDMFDIIINNKKLDIVNKYKIMSQNIEFLYYFIIDIILNIKKIIQSKSLNFLHSEEFLKEYKKIYDDTTQKYEEYIVKRKEIMAKELSEAYKTETYINVMKEIQNFFADVLTEKYNKLLEITSGIGTINISIEPTVTENPAYQNLLINITAAVAVGFLLTMSYILFFTRENEV